MLRILLVSMITLLLQACSTTVLTASCDNPRISNSNVPFVYFIMLPYQLKAGPEVKEPDAVSVLNSAAGIEILSMAANTHAMHVTLLESGKSECEISQVFQKIVQPNGASRRRLISSAVFYWGEVFPTDGTVVVQSHVRVHWNDERVRRIEVPIQHTNGQSTIYTADLPYSTVSFPPRVLPDREVVVTAGASSLISGLIGYVTPSRASERRPLPARFYIARKSGEWIELKTDSEGSVWVPVTVNDTSASSILPELSFAHALAGYINYRESPDSDLAEDIAKWFTAFREGYSDKEDPLLRRPAANADVIEGALELTRATSGGRSPEKAIRLLGRAAERLTDNSAVLNLAAIARMKDCCRTASAAIAVQEMLERARQIDPSNKEVARNLLNWYRQMQEFDDTISANDQKNIAVRAKALAAALSD